MKTPEFALAVEQIAQGLDLGTSQERHPHSRSNHALGVQEWLAAAIALYFVHGIASIAGLI
jgi:hypothetical protein